MMKCLATTSLLTILWLGQAVAEPCVSSAFDVPLPGAVNVVTRHADVPSPQFPGIWQEGILEGFFYALYANGEGVLKAARTHTDWEVLVACKTESSECQISSSGALPEGAQRVASTLALCLQGKSLAEPEVLAEPEAPEEEAVAPEEVIPTPCGIATVEDGPEGMVLQRLIVSGGGDPGPIDGIVGAGTRKALTDIIGTFARELEISEAIATLDRLLCERND